MRTFIAISILAVAVLAMSGCGTSQTNSWEEYMLVCHQPDGNWVYSKDEKKSPPGEEYEESVGFVRIVNEMMDDGWQLLSGVSVSGAGSCQTMVKD